jgi:hypothetical protein
MISIAIHKIHTLSMSSADYMPFLVTGRDGEVPA